MSRSPVRVSEPPRPRTQATAARLAPPDPRKVPYTECGTFRTHRSHPYARGSPNGTAAASAQVHNASARLAARGAPGWTRCQRPSPALSRFRNRRRKQAWPNRCRLRLRCDWLPLAIRDSPATRLATFPRKRLQTMSPLSQQIPLQMSGICRYVLDCRFALNQWRRRESNPRPRSREGWHLRA